MENETPKSSTYVNMDYLIGKLRQLDKENQLLKRDNDRVKDQIKRNYKEREELREELNATEAEKERVFILLSQEKEKNHKLEVGRLPKLDQDKNDTRDYILGLENDLSEANKKIEDLEAQVESMLNNCQ